MTVDSQRLTLMFARSLRSRPAPERKARPYLLKADAFSQYAQNNRRCFSLFYVVVLKNITNKTSFENAA